MNEECVKYSGCVAHIRNSKLTGVSEEDIFNMAAAIYNGVKTTSANDK